MVAFHQIYDISHCNFGNAASILRRFVNTFSKGYVKRETEHIKREKKNKNAQVKRRRLRYEQ